MEKNPRVRRLQKFTKKFYRDRLQRENQLDPYEDRMNHRMRSQKMRKDCQLTMRQRRAIQERLKEKAD